MTQGVACNSGHGWDVPWPDLKEPKMNGKLAVTFATLALLAGACSKQSGSVSVSAKAASTPADTSSSTCSGLSLNTDAICVTDVQIEIKKVKLEHAVAAADAGTSAPASDDGAGHMLVADHKGSGGSDDDKDIEDEDGEVKVGPCPLHLSGSDLKTGALSPSICTGDVPDGTFEELKVVIAAVAAAGDAGSVPSVVITGKLKDGTDVNFTSNLRAVQKTETSVTVDSATGKSLTITFDPTNWFTAADGSFLTPNATNQDAIEANIKASLTIFEDDDHDGHEDHGHGQDDGAGHH
jgi:hypothetical protein